MRLLDLELFGGLSVLIVSRMKLCVFTGHLSTNLFCAKYVIELSAMKVTRRDTNVCMKGENQLVSKKEQRSVPDDLNGLKVWEKGLSILVYQDIDVY